MDSFFLMGARPLVEFSPSMKLHELLDWSAIAEKMGSDHDFRLHSSYGRGLARDQAFVAKRRLIAGEPARAALSEAFR